MSFIGIKKVNSLLATFITKTDEVIRCTEIFSHETAVEAFGQANGLNAKVIISAGSITCAAVVIRIDSCRLGQPVRSSKGQSQSTENACNSKIQGHENHLQ